MKPLASILIPSLGRFDGLYAAVKSFLTTADRPDLLEIIIRLHQSDKASVSRLNEFSFLPVRIVQGPDKPAGAGNEVLWEGLRTMATGRYLQFWSDDMTIEGKGWDRQLEALEPHPVIHPEFHRLNESIYPYDKRGPTPFVHSDIFQTGIGGLTSVPDIFIHDLVLQRGWKVGFLKGVTVNHRRVEDATTRLANA